MEPVMNGNNKQDGVRRRGAGGGFGIVTVEEFPPGGLIIICSSSLFFPFFLSPLELLVALCGDGSVANTSTHFSQWNLRPQDFFLLLGIIFLFGPPFPSAVVHL
jgi:hypothetical protein